ncbi:hypothetical protein V6G14_004285 [Escherichia coli]|nr:hypothetical protein [Escherichia coli]EFB2330695.1 hypothetical protein [Escherichia coli]EHL3501401.1 hypothetical protein [Escherichia coli]EIP0466589.1 hypothetical protein [Escherichia coli]EJX3046767.1 hypothetical protein [Escherichia coli]EKY5220902.1 hypothetical protein [Escherichia coli]
MNDNVTLRVNGREWNGWTSVRIGAGIERLARDFSVEITRQWPGDEGITTLHPVPAWRRGGTTSYLPHFARCC